MSPFVPLHEMRAKDFMERLGLDAIVTTSPVNITYLTGYRWWLDPLFKDYMVNPGGSDELIFPGYAVLPAEGPPILIVSSFLAMNAVHLDSLELHVFGELPLPASPRPEGFSAAEQQIAELLQRPHETPTAALADALRGRGLSTARLGVELGPITEGRRARLSDALPDATLLDCTNLIRVIRSVKSSEEVELLAQAAAIAERAAHETLWGARPGDRLGRLAHDFRRRLAEANAAPDHLLFGASGLGISTASSHVLDGDVVANVDWGCVYKNYYSDAGSTFTMREPNLEVSERFAALGACVGAGARRLAAGARASEAHSAMIDTLEAAGVENAFSPSGHGIGLDVRDYPIVMADNGLRIRDDCIDEPSDLPLEENMVVALEVSQYEPRVGSFNHERVFVVTEQGGRELIGYERDATIQPRAEITSPSERHASAGANPGKEVSRAHASWPQAAVV